MFWAPVDKHPQSLKATPNLLDYDAAVAAFSWDTIRAELQGLPGGKGLNIAHEAVDRHAEGSRRNHITLLWLGSNGGSSSFTYAVLQGQSNRFANLLAGLGIGRAETVCTLAGKNQKRARFYQGGSLLQNVDFRSESRHEKNFTTGIVDILRIKF